MGLSGVNGVESVGVFLSGKAAFGKRIVYHGCGRVAISVRCPEPGIRVEILGVHAVIVSHTTRQMELETPMGHVEAAGLSHALPDGRVLLDDVSFRVGDGIVAALVGPNGAGKTTLVRLVSGDLAPQSGTVSSSGGLGVMRQFVGGIRDK